MAVKRKTIDLGKSMQEFDERIEAEKASAPSILETLAPIETHPVKKEVKVFDRKKERPDQKCIHFDRMTTVRINEIKNWKSIIGEKTTVEDIVYDAVQEYLAKHYDELKSRVEQSY
ncbi:MAG: hypothetical protein IJ635_08635 [Bacteroidaceae bacterium]|nr:hypothetical protein [Bacteroidaceae bacterium]